MEIAGILIIGFFVIAGVGACLLAADWIVGVWVREIVGGWDGRPVKGEVPDNGEGGESD